LLEVLRVQRLVKQRYLPAETVECEAVRYVDYLRAYFGLDKKMFVQLQEEVKAQSEIRVR